MLYVQKVANAEPLHQQEFVLLSDAADPEGILGSAAGLDQCSEAEVGDGSPPSGELGRTVKAPMRFQEQGRRRVDDGVRAPQVWGDGPPGPDGDLSCSLRDRLPEYDMDIRRTTATVEVVTLDAASGALLGSRKGAPGRT